MTGLASRGPRDSWVRAWHGERSHFIVGNDGSGRRRLILSRWYIEVTIFGRYVNVGML